MALLSLGFLLLAIMLGFIRNDTDVGFYNAAVRIKVILLGVVTSLGVVLLPRLSYYIEHNGFYSLEQNFSH